MAILFLCFVGFSQWFGVGICIMSISLFGGLLGGKGGVMILSVGSVE